MWRVLIMAWVAGAVAMEHASAAPAAPAPPAPPAERRRPNVVVFLADDLGWRDLGYAAGEERFYESPNVDKLAARGIVFTSAYAACPVCSPTRAALLTGRYPARVGVTDYIGGPQPEEAAKRPIYQDRLLPAPYKEHLPLEEVTVAEAFADHGYATMFAGKWHLGREPFHPDKQGFQHTVGASHRGSPGKGGYFSPYNVPLSPGPEGEHLDLRLASESATWIRQRGRDEPFLLWFSLYDVHTPLEAPAETVRYFEQKRQRLGLGDEFAVEGKSKVRMTQSHAVYAAMIKTMDDAVGIVIDALEKQGTLDETIIVFTSDNGGLSTAEGSPTSNAPLRAGKGWAYEGGVRVPLVMVLPRLKDAPPTCDVPATSTDFFPTLLAACGFAEQPAHQVDGTNLLPALSDESSRQQLRDRPLFWHYPHYGNQGGAPYSAVRAGDWKLIVFHDPRQPVELYNLAADPSERHNLVEREPAKVKALRERLESWKHDVVAVDATPQATLAR